MKLQKMLKVFGFYRLRQTAR